MGRIEKNADVRQDVESMKGEVIRTVKMQRRGRTMGCAVFALVAALAFAGVLTWLVAATGLVRVPVVSSVAYEKPEPDRTVRPGVPLDVYANNILTAELNRRLVAGGGQLQDRRMTLRLPEASFTSTLRSALEQTGIREIDASRSQVAVDPRYGLDLFLPLKDNRQETALRLRIAVYAEEGLLGYEIREVWIGSLRLSAALSAMLIGPLLDTNLAAINREIGRYADIHEIQYEEGEVVLDGEVNVDILQIRR